MSAHYTNTPAQLNSGFLQHNSSNGSSSHNLYAPTTPMVHTPYSCEHDLVPTYSEINNASQCGLGSSYNTNIAAGVSGDNEGMVQHNSNGSFGHQDCQSTVDGSATKYSRRSNNSSTTSPQPEASFSHEMSWNNSSSSVMNNNTNNIMMTPAAALVNQSQQQQGSSAANFPAFMMRAPIMNAPVHSQYLGGKAEYLEVPTTGAEITTAAQWNRQHKVFVGHVKFEVSADGLRWLIYMLTGVHAGKIEVRGMGCFMVFFASADDVFKVRGLHKRVLFDNNGIWFAQNAQQENVLQQYAANVAPSVHAKLPKGLMVVDEETSRRRSKKNKGPSAAAKTAAAPAPVPVFEQQGGFQSHATTQSANELWAAQQPSGFEQF